MRSGHADAQYLFQRLGAELGFAYRRTWSSALPTDGVWLWRPDSLVAGGFPYAALEVAVSESPKTLRGSLDTLSEVSPAIAVLVIHEVEMRNRLLRRGEAAERAEAVIHERISTAKLRAEKMQQRVQVWTYRQLHRRYELITGDRSPALLKRLTK